MTDEGGVHEVSLCYVIVLKWFQFSPSMSHLYFSIYSLKWCQIKESMSSAVDERRMYPNTTHHVRIAKVPEKLDGKIENEYLPVKIIHKQDKEIRQGNRTLSEK